MSSNKRKYGGKCAHLRDVSVSQNFLTERRLLERIVRKSSITKEDVVVEIGTGKAHLTKVLCKKCKYLYSIEIDRKLYEYSKKKMAGIENLRLVHGDFLKYWLPDKGHYKIFSNIPYNLTAAIIKKLSDTPNPADEMWLVMEKGAAKRYKEKLNGIGKVPGHHACWRVEIVYFFRREDFHPKPSVDSVLVHFERKH